MTGTAPLPVCRECGERIVRAHRGTGYNHVSRLVAACELDGDHEAQLDTAALGELPCAVCAAPVVDRGRGWRHVTDPPDDHPAAPHHPLI